MTDRPENSTPGTSPDNQIENPTDQELKASLEQAEFPGAAHMAAEIFGERPEDVEKG